MAATPSRPAPPLSSYKTTAGRSADTFPPESPNAKNIQHSQVATTSGCRAGRRIERTHLLHCWGKPLLLGKLPPTSLIAKGSLEQRKAKQKQSQQERPRVPEPIASPFRLSQPGARPRKEAAGGRAVRLRRLRPPQAPRELTGRAPSHRNPPTRPPTHPPGL